MVVQVTVGETLLVGVASAKATYVAALPMPPPLRIKRNLEVRACDVPVVIPALPVTTVISTSLSFFV